MTFTTNHITSNRCLRSHRLPRQRQHPSSRPVEGRSKNLSWIVSYPPLPNAAFVINMTNVNRRTVQHFPNMFMSIGPHQAYGNIPRSIEYAVGWIADCIEYLRSQNMTYIEAQEKGVSPLPHFCLYIPMHQPLHPVPNSQLSTPTSTNHTSPPPEKTKDRKKEKNQKIQ